MGKSFWKKQVDDEHPGQIRLPTQLIRCSEEAIRFEQGDDAALFDISPELNREIEEIAATFSDYLRDVGELDDVSLADRQGFVSMLDDMLKPLNGEGAIVYTAKHDRKFVGENWANKTQMTIALGYRIFVPATRKLDELVVPRKTKLF